MACVMVVLLIHSDRNIRNCGKGQTMVVGLTVAQPVEVAAIC